MKKIYENPMMEAVMLEANDVITTSGGNKLPDEESPF